MGAGATKMNSQKSEPININFITYRKENAFYCTIEREKYKLQKDILISFDKFNSFSKDHELENLNIKTKSTNCK